MQSVLSAYENQEKAKDLMDFWNDQWRNMSRTWNPNAPKGKRSWSTTMIHMATEVYSMKPAHYERIREKLGLISATTVRRVLKKHAFGDETSPALQKYVMDMVQKKTDKAEVRGEYTPSKEGTSSFQEILKEKTRFTGVLTY